jgi:hypothetical protein
LLDCVAIGALIGRQLLVRRELNERSALVVIPRADCKTEISCDFAFIAGVHPIENFFCILQAVIALRYDKTDQSFSA